MKSLALAALVLPVVSGCSGVATTQSFSPLSFFLPGLVQTKTPAPASSHLIPIANPPPQAQVAANRDSGSVKAN